jgi:hypothetical protein
LGSLSSSSPSSRTTLMGASSSLGNAGFLVRFLFFFLFLQLGKFYPLGCPLILLL